MGQLSLRLLGNCDGIVDGVRPLRLANRKSWGLLAYLALHPDQAAKRDHLATVLWGDRAGQQARSSLRQALYELRSALGSSADTVLVAGRDSVSLRFDDVDALRFRRLAETEDPECLADAVQLYRGPLLDGMEIGEATFDAWAGAERARFQEVARRALDVLARHQLKSGKSELALKTARRLVEVDPYFEGGHRLVMQALAACGFRNAALAHYKDLERLLRTELAIAPEGETIALRDALRRRAAPGEAAGEAPLRVNGTTHRRTVADNPALAVLPFENLSGDRALETFAAAISDGLVTALCKTPEVTVIALAPPDGRRGNASPVHETAGERGVHYVVEGSVQRDGETLRVTARLVDAASGLHVWGERYDRAATDLFALQDELLRQILVAIEVKLINGDQARADNRGATNLDAWLLRSQAEAEIWKFTRASTRRVRELFLAARDLAPGWSLTWGGIACSYWWEAKQGWAPSRDEAIATGIALAEKAVELGPDEPMGYQQLGHFAQLKGDHERAIALRETALDLSPNDLGALFGFAGVLLRAGHTRRALATYKRAAEVAPRHPPALFWCTAYAELIAGNREAAAQMADRVIAARPDNPDAYSIAAMAYMSVGRVVDAKQSVDLILSIDPDYSVAEWRTTQDAFKDRAMVNTLSGLLTASGLQP